MNIVNLANCANPDTQFNVGKPLCDLAKKKVKGLIFLDSGTVFTGADLSSTSSFINAVKAKTIAARGGRAYPIWDIHNFEDSTGEPSTGGIGNLTTATIITNDAIPVFRFGYNGSEARHARLAGMAALQLDFLIADEQWAVYGTDRDGNFGGYSVLQAYAYTSKFIISDAVNQYSFRLTLGSIAEYRDASRYIVANSGLVSAVGLINIILQYISNAANVYTIGVVADGGTNMIALHGAAIAGLTFTAVNLQTNAPIPVTTVAVSGSGDTLIVTFDSTAWGAMAAGDRFQLYGPSATALSGAGVKPFEVVSLTLVK